VLEAIEGWTVAVFLRQSFVAYPLLNALHVFGIAFLIGGIVLADLRLLGRLQALPAAAVTAVLVPTAATGLGLALVTGTLLFTVQAIDYAANPAFLAKLGIIALGLLNLARVHASGGLGSFRATGAADPPLRRAALVSLVTWPLVVIAGRFIGFL
jgi:hypothetical protein